MASQAPVRKPMVAVLAATIVWAACLTAQASAHPSASAAKKYSESTVTRAFRASGIGLYDTGYGALQPVTTLASTKPHQGWNVEVYIYLTPADASASYRGSIKEWQGAGMAAAVKKNVVVAVVPKTRITIAKSAKPWSMPELVAKTLASLPS